MAQSTKRTLRPNPFTAYREPDTGRWVVIYQASSHSEEQGDKQSTQATVTATATVTAC